MTDLDIPDSSEWLDYRDAMRPRSTTPKILDHVYHKTQHRLVRYAVALNPRTDGKLVGRAILTGEAEIMAIHNPALKAKQMTELIDELEWKEENLRHALFNPNISGKDIQRIYDIMGTQIGILSAVVAHPNTPKKLLDELVKNDDKGPDRGPLSLVYYPVSSHAANKKFLTGYTDFVLSERPDALHLSRLAANPHLPGQDVGRVYDALKAFQDPDKLRAYDFITHPASPDRVLEDLLRELRAQGQPLEAEQNMMKLCYGTDGFFMSRFRERNGSLLPFIAQNPHVGAMAINTIRNELVAKSPRLLGMLMVNPKVAARNRPWGTPEISTAANLLRENRSTYQDALLSNTGIDKKTLLGIVQGKLANADLVSNLSFEHHSMDYDIWKTLWEHQEQNGWVNHSFHNSEPEFVMEAAPMLLN